MTTAVSATGSRGSSTRAPRMSDRQRQKLETERTRRLQAIRERHDQRFLPKRILYTEDGAKKPRQEAWINHRLKSNHVLYRTLVLEDVPMRLLLRYPRKRHFLPVNLKELLADPRYKDCTMSDVLLLLEECSRLGLKKGFHYVDELREIQRVDVINAADTNGDHFALPEPDSIAKQESPVGDETQKLQPKDAEPQLGFAPRSQLHDKRVLRGQLLTWEPYRGQDFGVEIDPLEQWFVAVQTPNGPRHLVGEDFHRAFEVSGAVKDDIVRIIKRNTKDEPAVADAIEERHGSHGDGEHPSTHTRKDVYDVFIEKLVGSRRRTLPPEISPAPPAATTSASQPDALRDINLQGRVAREVMKHINDRPIVGWTIFRVKGQDAIHLRLLSLAPDDHVLLIVYGQDCMDRYVYREPLETSRRRVSLRLPDLVIRPAGPPAAQVAA